MLLQCLSILKPYIFDALLLIIYSRLVTKFGRKRHMEGYCEATKPTSIIQLNRLPCVKFPLRSTTLPLQNKGGLHQNVFMADRLSGCLLAARRCPPRPSKGPFPKDPRRLNNNNNNNNLPHRWHTLDIECEGVLSIGV